MAFRPNLITVIEPPPDAEFAASPTSGLAPLTVSFTDLSQGAVTSWLWNFGDGELGFVQNPTHTYVTPGTHSVVLTVLGPGGSSFENRPQLITVLSEPPPIAGFDAVPRSGAAPLVVSFADTSTGAVTSHSWSFGDGGTSTLANPQYVYPFPGLYTVTHQVTGPGGSDTLTQDAFIEAFPVPVADFVATPFSGTAPLSVAFQNLSTNAGSWTWSFGDGMSSNEENPVHVYQSSGVYSVSLTASGAGGSDTETKEGYISVFDAPVALFDGTPTSGPLPLTVSFSDSSGGTVTSHSWTFGDGGTSTLASPQHTYTGAGVYSVTLEVTGPGGSDTFTRDNYIDAIPAPVAEFAATPISGAAPLTVGFQDFSTNIVTQWTWSFGDGGSSKEENPAHSYASPGTYTVSLTATGPGGSDTETKPGHIVVYAPPVAGFSGSPTAGPLPLAVSFVDSSTGDVTSHSWSFGDGGTSTLANPQHNYTSAGVYSVTLQVSGPGGSDTLIRDSYVETFTAPVADFVANPTTGSAPLNVNFTDATANAVTSWLWDFGDPHALPGKNTSTEQNPQHRYQVPGTYTVSLTASGPGGTDVEQKQNLIVLPPIAAFSAVIGGVTPRGQVLPDGEAPFTVDFKDLSLGNVISWSWNFGNRTSSQRNPSVTYTAAGTYSVSLTVTSPAGVSDTETRPGLVVVRPLADFTVAPLDGCTASVFNFTNTVAVSGGTEISWLWDFGDGTTSTLANPTHSYTAAGTYAISLTATSPGGSTTEVKPDLIRVYDLDADFQALSSTTGECPLTVQFQDTSIGPVTSWSWDFGGGAAPSSQEEPLVVFSEPGIYSVSLTVTSNNKGCGVSTELESAYVEVLPRDLDDGSFEENPPGPLPALEWLGFVGTERLIQPIGTPTSDNGFPREGSQWLDISAAGSSAAQLPEFPWQDGVAPQLGYAASGTAGVYQQFFFEPAAPLLLFDVALLQDAPVEDFLSVEIWEGGVDPGTGMPLVGQPVYSLYYADGTSPPGPTSSLHGLPMHVSGQRVHDLAGLFPLADGDTLLTLRFSVGNGIDGTQPSRAYVDRVELRNRAIVSFENGTGLNRSCFTPQSLPPRAGADWIVRILFPDGAVVDGPPGPGDLYTSFVFVGDPAEIFGMGCNGLSEQLILGPPFDMVSQQTMGIGHHEHVLDNVAVPVDVSLFGTTKRFQGLLMDEQLGCTELCNAIDVLIGPALADEAVIADFDAAGGFGSYVVFFDNNSSDNATQFHWDFGDGTTSTLVNPVHQFETSVLPSYDVTVTLRAESSDNFNIIRKTVTVTQ